MTMGEILNFPGTNRDRRSRLEALIAAKRAEIAELDRTEPRSMNSEAYEEWADRHELLEDELDDLLDELDEL